MRSNGGSNVLIRRMILSESLQFFGIVL
jgi:hypothetical protein